VHNRECSTTEEYVVQALTPVGHIPLRGALGHHLGFVKQLNMKAFNNIEIDLQPNTTNNAVDLVATTKSMLNTLKY